MKRTPLRTEMIGVSLKCNNNQGLCSLRIVYTFSYNVVDSKTWYIDLEN